ncbi:MAG: SurA N-terminal domain-containing protein [bacterium]
MRNKLALIITILFIASLPALAATKPKPKKAAPKPKPAVKTAVKPAAKQPVEWVARVNGDIIAMEFFNKRVDAAVKEITKEISLEAAEEKGIIKETKKAILEQMIESVILLQWAEREGLEVADKTIKARIAEIKKSFPTAYEFHKSLAEQGMTPSDLIRDIKKQILIDKLTNMRAQALAVTDEEIKAFYDKNSDLYVQKEKFHLSQMLLKDWEEIQAERLKVVSGGEFSGEDIGLVEKGQLPVPDDQIFSLEPGKLSEIISGEAGYYVFKMEGKLPAMETKFEDVKDSIRKFLLKEKGRTQYMKDLQAEKVAAKIILNEKVGKLF